MSSARVGIILFEKRVWRPRTYFFYLLIIIVVVVVVTVRYCQRRVLRAIKQSVHTRALCNNPRAYTPNWFIIILSDRKQQQYRVTTHHYSLFTLADAFSEDSTRLVYRNSGQGDYESPSPRSATAGFLSKRRKTYARENLGHGRCRS